MLPFFTAENATNPIYIVIGSVSVVCVGVLIGVLVSVQRKKAYGLQWFPENYLSSNSPAGTKRSIVGGEEAEECKLDAAVGMYYLLHHILEYLCV